MIKNDPFFLVQILRGVRGAGPPRRNGGGGLMQKSFLARNPSVLIFIGCLAAFTLVEESLDHCNEMGEADHCATPWDFC